ncbi:MAG: c-type cytochrome [Candidatus Kapaibacterium sp.]
MIIFYLIMDFPLFHLDFIGNRMLIAVIAVTHVLINHSLAVGFLPFVTILEYIGFKERKIDLGNAIRWDEMTRKIMFVGFIITTSLGAMTGVGIWLAASLVNPASIGSLIRVFYGAWFTEWIVFVLEVVFIMTYYLTWKRSNDSDNAKKKHIAFGAFLSLFTWLTMAIIVAILGFMMDPGSWLNDGTFLSGVMNPLYLPQLYFRTPLSMMMGGAFGLFLMLFFVKKNSPVRKRAVQFASFWLLIWSPVAFAGAYVYYLQIPDLMVGNLPTAVATMAFADWYDTLLEVIIGAVTLSFVIALIGFLAPRKLPRAAMIIPILALFVFLGTFERIREFIRKPYVIGEYMYANGLRAEDYPLFKKDGLLRHATYSEIDEVREDNIIRAGEEVFRLACSRCHTVSGINSVVMKFSHMAGEGKRLDPKFMREYIPRMHKVWYYMPEFPGNDKELEAIVKFILSREDNPLPVKGEQERITPVSIHNSFNNYSSEKK